VAGRHMAVQDTASTLGLVSQTLSRSGSKSVAVVTTGRV
jgi:hypothetical protein